MQFVQFIKKHRNYISAFLSVILLMVAAFNYGEEKHRMGPKPSALTVGQEENLKQFEHACKNVNSSVYWGNSNPEGTYKCTVKKELEEKRSKYTWWMYREQIAKDAFINTLITGGILIWGGPYFLQFLMFSFSFLSKNFQQKLLPSLDSRAKRLSFLQLCLGFGLIILGAIRASFQDELTLFVLIGEAGVLTFVLFWAGIALIIMSALRLWTNFYGWLNQD